MYEIFKNVINSKRYNLDDMLKKIDTLWVQGDITEEQKKELEADLEKAIQKGRRCGISDEDMKILFALLLEG